MEALVVLVFLLLPLANGVAFALPILIIALTVNAAFLKYKVVTMCVHLTTIVLLIWNFLKEIEGELGRNSAFMVAHIIGVIICFSLYIIILNHMRKSAILISDDITTGNAITPNLSPSIDEKLISAVIDNNIEQVKELISQGANPRAKINGGYTAEDYARGRSLDAISDYFKEIPKQNK